MLTPGVFIDAMALGEDLVVSALVAVFGRHKPDGAMEVLHVVPGDEPIDLGLGLLDGRKRAIRVLGPVLQCPEERFRVGVVIADARTAEGGDDAERLQSRQESRPFHRRAIVLVKHEPRRVDAEVLTDGLEDLGSSLRAFLGVDLAADDFATPDVEKQVEIEEDTPHRAPERSLRTAG